MIFLSFYYKKFILGTKIQKIKILTGKNASRVI